MLLSSSRPHDLARASFRTLVVFALAAAALLVFGSSPASAIPFGGERVALGSQHICAIQSSGAVECVGGIGLPTGINNATAVGAGYNFSCAVENQGVKCWGRGTLGQLGNGSVTNAYSPVPVTGLSSGVQTVAVGFDHACALLLDATVKCWGNNGGALGNGSSVKSSVPVEVQNLTDVLQLFAGRGYTCALRTNGGVKCWGNFFADSTFVPVDVPGMTSNVVALGGAGDSNVTCVVLTAGTVKCMGYNGEGAVGDGTYVDRYSPVTVANVSGVATISQSSSGSSVCASKADGTGRFCWGQNSHGELAAGSTANAEPSPLQAVLLPSGVRHIAIGAGSGCGFDNAGALYCWGWIAGGPDPEVMTLD